MATATRSIRCFRRCGRSRSATRRASSVIDRSRDALAWAITHVVWQCRTARRRVGRRGETDELPERAVDGASHTEERDLVRAALATLATLAPRDVEVIVASLDDDDELRRSL